MRKLNLTPTDMVRVIRDSRDGSRDYFLTREEAHALFRVGKLHWDVTNEAYGTPERSSVKPQ